MHLAEMNPMNAKLALEEYYEEICDRILELKIKRANVLRTLQHLGQMQR